MVSVLFYNLHGYCVPGAILQNFNDVLGEGSKMDLTSHILCLKDYYSDAYFNTLRVFGSMDMSVKTRGYVA